MATTYGKNIKLQIYGGSHDEYIGMVLSGIPSGIPIDTDKLMAFMKRRAPGQNAYSTKRREPDIPVFLSGLSDSVTNGEDIHAIIYNTNHRSGDYSSLYDIPRPSHADYTARMKYGTDVDLRGGGHFSGRLTAPMCIAGGICLQILQEKGIFISAHIHSIADITDVSFDAVNVCSADLANLSANEFPTIDVLAGEKMKQKIEEARLDCDSVGGVIECAAIGLPVGLGEHMFDGVESRMSSIIFGIPAAKGIEFGLGFGSSALLGSQNNDGFCTDGKNVRTITNNCGGILGGMTNGMPLVFKVAFKPTPSIAKKQQSISLSRMENVELEIGGRHDPCIVPRAVPVVEAACAVAIVDMLMD
ncbi:MAG: chorismate synthase [Ruminococcaceae bacterium]|nr:chorismate synthase [Oscillospiraceae bacterium]